MPGTVLAACALLVGAHAGRGGGGRPPDGVVVGSATPISEESWAPSSQGPYRPDPVDMPLCRVEGTIEGNIGFELWLPQSWNGRLLGAGVGGDAGVYNYTDMSRRVREGFAVVSTDSGHKQSQARWMADPKARQDYEHRAVHLTAQVAKVLTARFYGRAVEHSYFVGCSGGGRQALKQMQLYPVDYDGVVAGAPGPYMPLQSVRMMWSALLQRDSSAQLTAQDWDLYETAVVRRCDKNDGVADGIIENPLRCQFETRQLLCKPGQAGHCLSSDKLAVLDAIIAPMPDEDGRAMDRGLQPGVRTRPGPPSPLLRAMWADGVYNDPLWDDASFRRSADLAAANRIMPELRADRVTLTPFIEAGGKAVLYQGWADPSTNADPTIDYYAAAAAANGGAEVLANSVRLFMVPGMYHCAGGPGADAFGGSGHPTWPEDPFRDVLWALIRWVEEGQGPDRLVTTKVDNGREVFTRALCPFPFSARHDGRGPIDDASSYACRPDAALQHRLMLPPLGKER